MCNSTIFSQLQEIVDDMCKNYCRYQEEAEKAMDEDKESERCMNCPLMRI